MKLPTDPAQKLYRKEIQEVEKTRDSISSLAFLLSLFLLFFHPTWRNIDIVLAAVIILFGVVGFVRTKSPKLDGRSMAVSAIIIVLVYLLFRIFVIAALGSTIL